MSPTEWPLRMVISGGQTGADQTGLMVARELGYATGGMMPKGWLTEDGPRPDLGQLYGLQQSGSSTYPPRTRWNVRASHGTVWFGTGTSEAGRGVTLGACATENKPVLINPSAEDLRAWIIAHQIAVLNVAGSRVSKQASIVATVTTVLQDGLTRTGRTGWKV